MSNADAARAEQASHAARARWGAQVVTRAAETVISRADELPDSLREQLHQVTEVDDQ